jgi:hypothetical protein
MPKMTNSNIIEHGTKTSRGGAMVRSLTEPPSGPALETWFNGQKKEYF